MNFVGWCQRIDYCLHNRKVAYPGKTFFSYLQSFFFRKAMPNPGIISKREASLTKIASHDAVQVLVVVVKSQY